MRILSLNVRGFGGLAKQRNLRTLLLSFSPDMILLQETMCSPYPTLLAFSKLCPGWEFYAISSTGLSGGFSLGGIRNSSSVKPITLWHVSYLRP